MNKSKLANKNPKRAFARTLMNAEERRDGTSPFNSINWMRRHDQRRKKEIMKVS